MEEPKREAVLTDFLRVLLHEERTTRIKREFLF